MDNTMRLLRAFIEAQGYEIEESIEAIGKYANVPDICNYKVTKKATKPRKQADMGYSEEFLDVWEAKPSRSGNGKPEAFKVFCKAIAGGSGCAPIYDGVRRYAAYVEATKTEFVYKLSNFIKNELYLESWDIPKGVNRLKLPADDNQLVKFAAVNNLPSCKATESYFEYRQRLNNFIETMVN